MRASVPQDVDLEDRLVYGLTPVRFGYLVVAGLGAMSLWGLRWLPLAARLVPCFLLVLAGVVLAWGRWRGRPVDRLLVDIGIFLRRNYRIQLSGGPRREPGRRSSAERLTEAAPISFAAINAMGRRTPAPLEAPP
jgi:hypothetical protein